MATYIFQDLECEDDGDLVVDGGDLSVASVRQSMKQYLLTWTTTTRPGYAFDPGIGWGGEDFVGRPNTPIVHRLMEQDLGYSFGLADGLATEDLVYSVAPVSLEIAAVTLRFNGLVIEPDGSSPNEDLIMAFSFPFSDGQIQLEVS